MSSLKSTPRRIVTNFFFGLNAACKPPRRPHSNTPPASLPFPSRIPAIPLTPPAIPLTHPCNSPHTPLPFPSRPEGAEAPSPGHSPWVFMSPRLAPCRGKSFIRRPEYDIQAKKNRRKDDVNGFFFVLLYAIKEMQDLWNLDS